MKYIDSYLKKINQMHNAFSLIRLNPHDKDNYINLYYNYLRSYPYMKKIYQSDHVFVGNLGTFYIVDFMFEINKLEHEFTIKHNKESIVIASEKGFYATYANFTNSRIRIENNYLHTFQGVNTKNFKANSQNFFNSRN